MSTLRVKSYYIHTPTSIPASLPRDTPTAAPLPPGQQCSKHSTGKIEIQYRTFQKLYDQKNTKSSSNASSIPDTSDASIS